MKRKDTASLRRKNIDELQKQVKKKRIDFIKEKAELKAGRKKNVKKARNLKTEIAQILTVIREKEILEQSTNNKEQKGEEDRKK